jgi:hypothetical protein
MEERVNPLPAARSWADEIDDLYHVAAERNLRAMLGVRVRNPTVEPRETEIRLPAADTVERGAPSGGIPQ